MSYFNDWKKNVLEELEEMKNSLEIVKGFAHYKLINGTEIKFLSYQKMMEIIEKKCPSEFLHEFKKVFLEKKEQKGKSSYIKIQDVIDFISQNANRINKKIYLEKQHTKILLKRLNTSRKYGDSFEIKLLKEILATREHVTNKKEGKEIRRNNAKKKK